MRVLRRIEAALSTTAQTTCAPNVAVNVLHCARNARRLVSSTPSETGGRHPGDDGNYYLHFSETRRGHMTTRTQGDLHGMDLYFPPNEMHIGISSSSTSPCSTEGSALRQKSAPVSFVDTSTPLVTEYEAECWKLDRLLLQSHIFFLNDAPPERQRSLLLPADRIIPSLGGRMTGVDKLYRRKGLWTPSEVAAALMPYIATFFVEFRLIRQRIPPQLILRIDERYTRSLTQRNFFGYYNMLFDVTPTRFGATLIKLNSEMDFVVNHPYYAKADRLLRRYNNKYSTMLSTHLTRQDSAVVSCSSDTALDTSAISGAGTCHVETCLPQDQNERGRAAHEDNTAALAFDAPSHGTTTKTTALTVSQVDGGMSDRAHTSSSRAAVTQTNHTATVSASPPADTTATASTRRPIELQVLDIFVRNLPRVPPDAHGGNAEAIREERFAEMPLVQWINSFSPTELDVLNSISQQRVLSILSGFVHVFQLTRRSEEDGQVYVDRQYLSYGRDRAAPSSDADGGTRSDSAEAASAKPLVASGATQDEKEGGRCGCDDGGATCSDVAAQGDAVLEEKEEEKVPQVRHEAADSYAAARADEEDTTGMEKVVVPTTPAHTRARSASDDARVRRIKMELQDELVGLDELFNSPDGGDSRSVAATLPAPPDGSAWVRTSATDEAERIARQDTDTSAAKELCHEPVRDAERERSCQGEGVHGSAEEVESRGAMSYIVRHLDTLYVRRIPPHIAPRSLSNFDEATTPEPEIVRHVMRVMGRTLHTATNEGASGGPSSTATPFVLRRWISLARLYRTLSTQQRQHIQRYRGLAHFLRLHGALFELSMDRSHVIVHDPSGRVAPLIPTQLSIRFEERVVLPANFDTDPSSQATYIGQELRGSFARFVGDFDLPRTRTQLALVDPLNPLMCAQVLDEELANILPSRPIKMVSFLKNMPPVMRAALPMRRGLVSNAHYTVFQEKGQTMIARADVRAGECSGQTKSSQENLPLSAEEALQELLSVVPADGATVHALINMHLSNSVVEALITHFGSVYAAVHALPQHLEVESNSLRHKDSVIRLRVQH